jgi:hypothetical protein
MALEYKLQAELANEARRIEEDALFSGKGHYNAAAPWRWWYRTLAILVAVSSTVAGTSALKSWSIDVTAVAAFVSAIVGVILATLKPSEEADRHQQAANRYLAVKNRARIFQNIELLASAAMEIDLVRNLKLLSADLDDIRQSAPQIPQRAYEKARKEIEVDKTALYAVDKPQT